MSDAVRCPDCGHQNPAGSESCGACNFPLADEARPTAEPSPPDLRPPDLPRPRMRPRRLPRGSNQAVALWLGFGILVALAVLFIAIRSNVQRASVPVEGAAAAQQRRADDLRAALERDSTDLEARVALGDLLFDTGNWSEAMIHYRSAARQDSTRVPVLVDLGVCYYNLGDAHEAERLFRLALSRDPHQPVALFNLGIVHERRSEHKAALEFFHRALQSGPPESMQEPLVQAIQRVAKSAGATARPLPDGR